MTMTDVVVRDGSTVCLRHADAADATALRQFLHTRARETVLNAGGGREASTPRGGALPGSIDGTGTTLLAEAGGRIVGCAVYRRDACDAGRAAIAVAVAEDVRGHGIGTRLLEQLAQHARASGIRTFDAHVSCDDASMLELFRNAGFAETVAVDGDVCRVQLSLTPTDAFVQRAAARSETAARASLQPFFAPRVVAVIGANRSRGRIGSEILNNLRVDGFTGTIIPVHPAASEIAGLRAYRRVGDIPAPVDLAIIVVPASEVLAVVDDCIGKHVRALCVISAGFGECGAEGRARERLLLDKVRRAGCRLIGPNCMGLLNTDPAIQLNATFSPVFPPRGNIAMSTQSGALGLAILDYARQLDIGISSFVSVGNKADVSGNDLIQYWADDPNTSVILLYLESFGNPKTFAGIARRVARTKPIVAVKAGRSAAGSRAAASHTGALATRDVIVDALFRQAGVIRTGRIEEMFDVARLLSHQPIPRGPRVAILTNAGGPGILAADACEANGLQLPLLDEATRSELQAFLPAAASVGNPVDMLASAPPEHYRRALEVLLRDGSVDSVITIFIPPLVTHPDAVAAAIAAAAGAADKPVLGVFMRSAGAPAALAPIPSYAFPESAALALARVTAYAMWRRRPLVPAPPLARVDGGAIRRIVDNVLTRGGGWVGQEEAQELLTAAGICTAASRVAHSEEEALAAASYLGYPVVLKALGPALLHKTERQAVTLHLADEGAVRSAYSDFVARFGGEMSAVLVQEMVAEGVEMIVGAYHDPMFGPVLACGTGGVLVDILADTAVRLHPLDGSDAAGMLDELRGVRLLRGFRGRQPADEAALREVLMRVSELVRLAPEIHELDLNPVIVLAEGARVVDVRVRIEAAAPITGGRRVEY